MTTKTWSDRISELDGEPPVWTSDGTARRRRVGESVNDEIERRLQALFDELLVLRETVKVPPAEPNVRDTDRAPAHPEAAE